MRTQQEEVEIIKAALDNFPGYKNVQSNLVILLEACQGRPISSVGQVLRQVKSRLTLNQDYAEAYQQLWAEFPEFKTDANQNYLDGLITSLASIDVDTLRRLITNPQVRESLTLTTRATAAIANEHERLQLIEKILGTHMDANGNQVANDKYGWRGNVDGRLYEGHRHELESDSLERLREIFEIVDGQRKLYAANTADVRAEQQKRELREKQIRAGMTSTPTFATLPEFYESPNRPGTKIQWSENFLRRLPNAEVSRLFETYGEEQLNDACRQTAAKQLSQV
jgi:hypothetical protein